MTGRRLDYYTSFRVDVGVTDVTKNSRLFTVISTTCSTLLLAVFFPPIGIQPSTSPAHPVPVPIRHASDKSSVVTSFETDVCIHRKYNKVPGAYMRGIYLVLMRVASGLFSWSYGCGSLGIFKSPAFTYNQSWPPVRFTLFSLPEQA